MMWFSDLKLEMCPYNMECPHKLMLDPDLTFDPPV